MWRNCEYAHSTNPTLEPFGILGENLLLHITDADDFSNQPILGATTTWHNEVSKFLLKMSLRRGVVLKWRLATRGRGDYFCDALWKKVLKEFIATQLVASGQTIESFTPIQKKS